MFSILRNPMSSGIRYLEQPTSLIPVIGITPRLQQPNLINLSSLASLNALSLSVVQSYSNRSISSQALSKLTVKYYSNGRNPQTPQKIMLPGLLAISVVINGSNNDQKTYYGKEKVTNIICSNSVTLNGTTVTDRVNVGGSINAINASI